MSSVEEKVMDIVSEQLSVPRDEITRDSSYVDDLKADSLDIVELVMELEDEFDISIPEDEVESINTVGATIDFINKATAAN